MKFLSKIAVIIGLSVSPISGLSAATDCASGRYVADAQIVPPSSIGRILRATQFAWDGDNRIVNVCNLMANDADYTAFWQIFSREVDRNYGGICIQITGTNGRDVYSCATPAAVQRAFDAPVGSRDHRLHFDTWQPGLRANIN